MEDYLGHVLPANPEEAHSRGWLFALADGVGGHAHGEVASHAAVEHILAGFRANRGELMADLLPRLVQAANLHVYELGRKTSAGGTAMATTIVLCGLRFDRAVVAHAGDSRCYLVRKGQAVTLTRDHTMASEQARLGLMSAKEAASAGNRHILTRSLGNDLFVKVDVEEHPVLPGDVLVMCSDGLHGSVQASEIAAVTGHGQELPAAAEKLVALANQRDGSDNISVQVIRVRAVERVGMYRGRPYQLR